MRYKVGFASVALLTLVGACTSSGTAPAETDFGADPEWSMFGHDLHNTRSNTTENEIGVDTVANLELTWEHVGSQVTSTPAVVDGVVYFADWTGLVYAKNVADGSEVWTEQVSPSGMSPSLAVTDDRIFIGDFQAIFYAVDRATGAVIWSEQLDDHPDANITSSAVPVDDMLLVGVASGELGEAKEDYTFRGSIVALAQDDGEELWRVYVTEDDETSGAGVSVWSSAAVDQERELMFIGTGNTYEPPASPMSDSVVAVNYRTGVREWARQFTENDVYTILQPPPQGPDADIGAAPNLFRIGGRPVVGVGDKGGVYAALDRDTGDVVWATTLGPGSHLGGVMNAAAYNAGRIFVVQNYWPGGFNTEDVFFPEFEDPDNTSEVISLNARTGAVLWRTPVASPTVGGGLLYSNGLVFTGHTLGLLRAYDADSGDVLWEDQVGATLASGQVISDGRLFVTHGFSFLGITGGAPGAEGGLRVYELAQD